MMALAFRHLRRHWRTNSIVLLCLTLASALLAGLSGYTAAVSAAGLQRSLEGAGPAERSLLITGTLYTFDDDLYDNLQQTLGRAFEERVVIRHATLPADRPPRDEGAGPAPLVTSLEVYSFDKLAQNVRLVEGRLPEPVSLGQGVGYWPPPVEAVIGAAAAEQSGHGPGDRLTASGLYHRLDIVGVVEPLDPGADVWGGDLGAFVVAEGGEPEAGTLSLPLIVASQSMRSYLGRPVFPHQIAWRITLDTRRLDPGGAEALREALTNFQTQATTRGAQAHTGLIQILAEALARLSRLRVALLLLAAQTLALVLYTLAMLSAFVVDGYRREVAILSARGLGPWRIARGFALEFLLLALPAALLLGPGLALGVLYLWSQGSGAALLRGLSGEMWLLPAASAAVGWLTLVVPIFFMARRHGSEPQPWRARPPQRSALHKRYVDLYLLAFGGLLVWQLNRSGSFLARALGGSRPLADPLLLLGPFVLLVALALVLLRIVPGLLRLIAGLFRSRRGLVLPLGLLRPARDPLQASRLVLLVALTTGLLLFARIFHDSLARGPEALRSDALVQGLAGVFQLNALMLASFGVVIFFLIQWLAGRGRAGELGVLRALGLGPRRWPALSVIEGGSVLLPGLVVGIAAGLGLAYVMIPYLSDLVVAPLVSSPKGAEVVRVVVDGPALVPWCAALLALYGSALVILWLVLGRARPRRAFWPEEE
ncbi:MAG: ABC transporter permease [Anaerolineae bacterium]